MTGVESQLMEKLYRLVINKAELWVGVTDHGRGAGRGAANRTLGGNNEVSPVMKWL